MTDWRNTPSEDILEAWERMTGRENYGETETTMIEELEGDHCPECNAPVKEPGHCSENCYNSWMQTNRMISEDMERRRNEAKA